jgi:hypothetical protein
MLYVLVLDDYVQTFATFVEVLCWVEKAILASVPTHQWPFTPSLGNGIRITTDHGRTMTRIKAVMEVLDGTSNEPIVMEFRVHLAEIPKGCCGIPAHF